MQMQQHQTTWPFFLDDSVRKHKTSSVPSREAEYFQTKKMFQRLTQEESKLPICNQLQPEGMPQLQTTLVLSSILQYLKIQED